MIPVCLQIAELQKELAELERQNEELEDEIEARKEAYLQEIEDLEVSSKKLHTSPLPPPTFPNLSHFGVRLLG